MFETRILMEAHCGFADGGVDTEFDPGLRQESISGKGKRE